MFIVLEGIDGSGKTSVCRTLSEKLTSDGFSVSVTSEPTPLIRPLLSDDVEIRDPVALFLLFMADRMHHQQEIGRLTKENDIVLCDRYLLSSLAYQGALISEQTRDWDETVRWMNSVAEFVSIKPDFTLFLDVDPVTSLKRIREKRKGAHPYFEREGYLMKVRDAYMRLLGPDSVSVDSNGTLEEAIDGAYAAVRRFLSHE